jgi:hypothetical protein
VEIRHIEPDNAHEIDALAAGLGNTARGINAAANSGATEPFGCLQ